MQLYKQPILPCPKEPCWQGGMLMEIGRGERAHQWKTTPEKSWGPLSFLEGHAGQGVTPKTPLYCQCLWSLPATWKDVQGCTLHPGQLAEWEGKVLGPRASRSIGNLSKTQLSPTCATLPTVSDPGWKGQFPSHGSHRGFTVELPVFRSIVRPLHLRQSMNSLTLPGTGLKAQASNWC